MEDKLSKCNWKCKFHDDENPEYCKLELWHEKATKCERGEWIYEGHIFKCIHPIGIYTIFLLDISASMRACYALPTINKIIKKQNNMLGAAIESLYNFCRMRAKLSPIDKCALISFNDSAVKLLENINVMHNDFVLSHCLENLRPIGNTNFKNAFEKAVEIMNSINRKKIGIVIILLTDGLDQNPEDTLTFVKNVRKNIF